MDFVPSSLTSGASTFIGATISGAIIVGSSTISGAIISNSTVSGSTIVASTISGATIIGGTISGATFAGVTVNSGSTVSAHSLPTQMVIRVNRGGTDQTINNNVYTQINMTTESQDDDGVFTTGNDRYLPTLSGTYLLIAAVTFSNSVQEDYITSSLYKNGSQICNASNEISDAANDNTAIAVCLAEMNGSSDYIEHYCRQVNAATTDRDLYGSTDRTYFHAVRVSK